MRKQKSFDLKQHYRVMQAPQTYRNAAYLLLSFPLGIVYFVFFVTGLSLGVGLIPILIGLPLLVAVLYTTRGLAVFERQLANQLLNMNITPARGKNFEDKPFLGKLLGVISDAYTWRSAIYALLKFPLGIASFVVTIVAYSIPLSMIASLLTYADVSMMIGPGWVIDTFPEAVFATGLGVLMLPFAAHFVNLFAGITGVFANVILGEESAESLPPSPPQKKLDYTDQIVILKSAEKEFSTI